MLSSSKQDCPILGTTLLALNGLRASEAQGADIEDTGLERGHHTLRITRKGGTSAVIPLAPRTARTVYQAIGDLETGPIFINNHGERMDRHHAARIIRRLARRTGIHKTIRPHSLRHSFITAALDAEVPLRNVQEAAPHADPRTIATTEPEDRLDRHATYIVATFLPGRNARSITSIGAYCVMKILTKTVEFLAHSRHRPRGPAIDSGALCCLHGGP